MDIRLTTDVNTDEFDYLVGRYIWELGLSARDVVSDQARFLFQQLLKFSAPDTYAQGRLAVKHDILRAMRPMDPSKYTSDRIRKLINAHDVAGLQAVMQAVPGWRKFRVLPFSESLHKEVRNRRGRVPRDKNVLVVGLAEHNRYTAAMQRRVGYTKSSWKRVLQATGGKVPGWVARHDSPFSTLADFREDTGHPRITVDNRSVGITNDPQFANDLRSAIAYRTRAMESDLRYRLTGDGQRMRHNRTR